MKLKATGLLLVLGMLMGLSVTPAAANQTSGTHVGVFSGTAGVGKTSMCNEQTGQASNVGGGGIGLPVDPETLEPTDKNRLGWRIEAGLVVDTLYGLGTANLCGTLNKVEPVEGVSLGASCLTTKGWNGGGEVEFPGEPNPPFNQPETLQVSDLTWKAALGGTFVAWGQVDRGATKKTGTDLLLAVVQVVPDENSPTSCLDKVEDDKAGDGEQELDVVAAYAVVGGAGQLAPEKDPDGKKA